MSGKRFGLDEICVMTTSMTKLVLTTALSLLSFSEKPLYFSFKIDTMNRE